MKFSLSTNWCNRRIDSGEEIAEKAISLGFDELELGFHTTDLQVVGFKKMRDQIPVGSVHAFCPVPISAPQGYPELYQLASFDEEARKMARFQILKNIHFAAEMGADSLVLHAGRVLCRGLFASRAVKRRLKRGAKMVEILRRELEGLVPELEKAGVCLGLENLPYLEGFPGESEMAELAGPWVQPWFDTGHDFVRQTNGWLLGPRPSAVRGLHVNDSVGGDDHLAPGKGYVDFAALRPLAEQAKHLVFEPHEGVSEEELKDGLDLIRRMWQT